MPPLDPQAQQVLNQRNGAPQAPQQAQPRPQPQAQPQPMQGGDPIVRPADPYRQSAEQRAQQDQAFQAEQLRLSREASERAAQGDARAQATFEGTGGTATESQAKVSTMLTRILGGSRDIAGEVQNNPDAQSPGFAETVSRGVMGEGMVTRAISGQDRRIVSDAQRDMIDALLTLSTGAAYTPEQVVAQQVAHFPQYGDTPEEITIKNQRLARLMEAARVAAGPQWGEIEAAISPLMPSLTGGTAPTRQEPLSQGGTPVAAGGNVEQEGTTVNGGGLDPDPNGGVDEYGTPLRLMDGQVLQNYTSNGNGGLAPVYGPPEPTRTGVAATILGDGTRSIPEQLGAGVGDVLQGVVGTAGMIANPINQGINAAFGTNLSTDIGATARDMSGLPDNPNPLYSAITQGAASAMTFGGAARGLSSIATNPTTSGVLSALGQTPVRDAAAGASAGAGAYAARDAGPAGQFAAALGAGALGYGAAGMVGGSRSAAGAAQTARRGANEVIEAGQREGVRVMTTDVVPPRSPIGNLARNTGERIPYAGTGGNRVRQQAEREQVVRNIAQEYGVTGNNDYVAAVSADLARTRGQQLTGLTNRKSRIIDNIPGQVQTPLAVAEIDNQIAKLQRNFEPEQVAPVVNQLQTFRRALASGRDLRGIEEQRRLLGDAFAAPELANVRSTGEASLSAVYAPLREDMTNFIRDNAGPEVADRFTNTNNRLSAMVGELDAANFRRALSQADVTPESAANLLFSRNESDVSRLVGNLSPRGRNAAQSAIIYRAISAAGDLNAVAGLSPQQFANAIERYSTNIGVVFRPQDVERLQGVQRLLQATQRASTASANPPTGVQNNIPIVAAVLTQWLGTAAGALTTGGLGGLMARAYESPAMRDRLINLARAEPGSPREARTLESLARIMASQPALREALTRPANDNAALSGNVAAGPENDQQR